MPDNPNSDPRRACGSRAEEVASWYFRVNGFMVCEGFVVHPPEMRYGPAQRTEADLYGIRFPHSVERVGRDELMDDGERAHLDLFRCDRPLFILVEVKAGQAAINGPWSRRDERNMETVIGRMGFLTPSEVPMAADAMYDHMRYTADAGDLRYVTVSTSRSQDLQTQYPSLTQIVFDDIAEFLFFRFKRHPMKISRERGYVHGQWPRFARMLGQAICQDNRVSDRSSARQAVQAYISQGNMDTLS